MGDLTKNLSRHEFACHCGCGLAEPHPLLVCGIQCLVRFTNASSVLITSGTRCDNHNDELHTRGLAAPHSWHKVTSPGYSRAADCVFGGVPLYNVVIEALGLPQFAEGGIGIYVGDVPRVHLDVRGYSARWGYHKGAYISFDEALRLAQEAKRNECV